MHVVWCDEGLEAPAKVLTAVVGDDDGVDESHGPSLAAARNAAHATEVGFSRVFEKTPSGRPASLRGVR
jgi:hypothetical protein